MNAFWATFGETEAEQIWAYTHKYGDLDLDKKEAGCELDELNAHRLLEAFEQTMTVRELREGLRTKGAIEQSAKKIGFMVPLSHFLIMRLVPAVFPLLSRCRYDTDFHVLVNAPQGNQEEVDEAQRRLEVAQAALTEAQNRASEAKARQSEAVAAENEAKGNLVSACYVT